MANFINSKALIELDYILKRINNLKILNLTKNFIKSTDLDFIKSLNVKEELILSRNLITNYIPEDFMLHLKSIDLSYNKLTSSAIHNLKNILLKKNTK